MESFEVTQLKTLMWVDRHNVPPEVRIRMAAILQGVSSRAWRGTAEATCRWLYTQALRKSS
jgi:hypothetical protein